MLCCPCRKLQEGFDLNPKPDETAISRHIGYVRTELFFALREGEKRK